MRTGYFDTSYGNYLPYDEPSKPFEVCAYCGCELYVGEDAYEYNSDVYCSEECFCTDIGLEKIQIEEDY